jgi:hypothetical protein
MTVSMRSQGRIYPSNYSISAQRRRLLWAGYAYDLCQSGSSLTLRNMQITQPFEMYIAVSQGLPKSAVISAANAVARWVKKEEGRLFLRDAPIF